MINTKKKNQKKHKAFSLAEALITLLVICIVVMASVPVITKKRKKMENVNRNSFACYWKGNTIVGKYNLNGKVSDAQTVTETGPDGTSRTGCRFDPPNNAKNFVVTVVGGGGGGAAGKGRAESFVISGGTQSGNFTVPVDGLYKILAIGSGGAGGHTSSEQVRHKSCSQGSGGCQPPATTGSPAGMVITNDIKLDKNGKISYSLVDPGWAREDNDGHASNGGDTWVTYTGNDSQTSAYRSFTIGAQGGGAGACTNYDGKDKTRWWQCTDTRYGERSRNADSCIRDGNGFYPRYGVTKKGNKESHPYIRGAHAGGAGVTNLNGFSSSDFKLHYEASSTAYGSIFEYEKPGAYRMNSSGGKATGIAYKDSDNWGRPYRNSALTYARLVEFKLWDREDLEHPIGSGGYGSGGGLKNKKACNNAYPNRCPDEGRNHKDPKGNGGYGAVSIVWNRSYAGFGGTAGQVLQLPFAQLPKNTLCFPGKGGAGGVIGHYGGYDGEYSYLKNYPTVGGGKGASEINYDSSSTYYDSKAGEVAKAQSGELANINPVTKQEGGAGGFTTLDDNGYIDNSTNYNGLTREMFANGVEIGMFTQLFGAGSGGGGGTGWIDQQGEGGDGSSGIVFIQW